MVYYNKRDKENTLKKGIENMTKFEVYKESKIEAKRGCKEWTSEDMLDFNSIRRDTNFELIGSFESKEEAQEFFEEQKQYCVSFYQDGYIYNLVIFDIIQLCEVDYNEDGEFLQMGIIDEYAVDIK